MSRYEDDNSYDYSDYCEGRGYYESYTEKPFDEDEASLRRIEAREEKEREAKLYPPIGKHEMQERIKEVKTRLGVKQDENL
jgi:hypothetical protein